MRNLAHLTLSVLVLFALMGCRTHTVVGNGNGDDSPDGRFTLQDQVHGAPGKAFNDMSKKRVFLSIWKKPPDYLHNNWQRLYFRKYEFTGACVCQHVQWDGPQTVTVDFYDFGDSVDVLDAQKAAMPSNHVASLTFVLDTATGKFAEKK